jgi:methyl-accepting chemotaxis protein
MKLSNISLAKKLFYSFALVSLIAIVQAITVWTSIKSIEKQTEQINKNSIPQSERISLVQLAVTRASLQLRHAMLMRTPEKRREALKEINHLRSYSEEVLGEFETNIGTEDGRSLFAAIQHAKLEFWSAAGKALPLIEENEIEAAIETLERTVIPSRDRLIGAITDQKVYQQKLLNEKAATVLKNIRSSEVTLLMFAVAASVLGCVIAAFLSRTISRPLVRAVGSAKQIAAGDLSQAIHSSGRDEAGQLLIALAEMQTKLNGLVAEVRRNAETLSITSVEIANGNHDLSARTETQASALEQTCASMEELSSTVKQNAQNAREANQLAIGATTVATKGGEVIGQVTKTMKEINDSSKRITEIISVIESIAFQTNILALNAAVEAARAGEHGRGFAVVASEVRNLASRSANAAKEIKTLINDSEIKVKEGSSLVDNAGNTMSEIVRSIGKVSEIMREISLASDDQAAGVSQMGQAISQMDQTTQQNAALVEQMAAAASSMKDQASELVQSVDVFKLNVSL